MGQRPAAPEPAEQQKYKNREMEHMAQKTIKVETVAQAYLELLRDREIDCFFANAGTDFAPLIDAFALFAHQGKGAPKPITVPHENAAVAMAHGYYLATGRPQVVMVHVNVGTANAINGIINAARDNIPIIFTAGRTPLTESGLPGSRDMYIHWSQECFDQAAMVREWVKWDYELRNFAQLEEVVDRALEIAMTEPRGPVYLTLPREVLAERHEEIVFTSPSRRSPCGPLHPDPEAIREAAVMLAAASNPLVITSASGRNADTVVHLAKLAESFAIPVITFNPRHVCLPTDHPMHAGYFPSALIQKSDCILALDSEVPWYPSMGSPPDDCKIIHMGIDPLQSRYPIRSFPCDLAIRADSAYAVPMLTEALAPYRDRQASQIAERFNRVSEMHARQLKAWKNAAEAAGKNAPLDPVWISHCINEVKDEQTIILNEYDLVLPQMDFTSPGQFLGNTSVGGLGWGLGASIGVKMGSPESLVILCSGEGSYMFGNPTPCHFVSRAFDAPTLTIVFNNGCWNAVRQANIRMHPNGWAARTGNFPLSDLEPVPHYEKIVTASGGYAERVEDPSQVLPALHRAIHAVRVEKRQAVLNMVCKHPRDI